MKPFLILACMCTIGCVHYSQIDTEDVLVETNTTPSRPPPFWPPHEHTLPFPPVEERYWDVHLELLDAQAGEDHWNHTTFEFDPTKIKTIQ
jgi:hypothetical protein